MEYKAFEEEKKSFLKESKKWDDNNNNEKEEMVHLFAGCINKKSHLFQMTNPKAN